ncbi:hypothetical protein KM043_001931 [Ampulex compressa]|nr:hypothetical protein KM043_001931 [Ampulex compressa]
MLKIIASALLLYAVLLDSIDAQYQGQQSECATPDAIRGTCIGIRQCPPLLSILQSRPLSPQAIDFLRKSQCGFEGNDPKVCCPNQNSVISTRPGGTQGVRGDERTPSSTTEMSGGSTELDLSNNPLLPADCGQDLSQRIVGGERTELGEFAWMTLLEYRKPNGRTTACGGVLINKRYVLTAAHCIKGKDLPSTWVLESVRLGEHNTETDPDCVQDDEDLICADSAVWVGVEEQIAHEEYRPNSREQRYDIALLRLSRDVQFTNYIKPICLPSTDSLGQKLYVAGWGRTENRSSSNIKLKLSLPIADREQCDRTYSAAGLRLGYGQICAGGQRGKDSCRGDSGGPLMALERALDGTGRWTAVGVVSFGPSPCGLQGWPGVYTRVVDFVPWILSKLRA